MVETEEQKLTRSLKLVPTFDEYHVAEWFVRFEKKALEFQWPPERWVALVANVLRGEALEVYDNLSGGEGYEELKGLILTAYKLRPEAYRLMFRNAWKRPVETYLSYARYLRETLNKWIRSEGVDSFDSLKELILMEHFINNVDKDIAIKLREKRCKTMKEAATLADDRALAQRGYM